MNTVLITGATGFLGRYAARHFQSMGWKAVGLGTRAAENAPLPDLAQYVQMELPCSDLATVVREVAPDVCIHCAGRASVELSMTDPSADFQSGVAAVFNMLDTLRLHAPECRTIYLSSAAVYGNPARLPVRETDTPQPISPYGFHKLMGEQLCLEFHRVYGLRTTAVRIFSAYGPGLRRQVVWDVCRKALTEPVLTLRGTGTESRDFIHARDVASALAVIAEKADCQAEVYNLASGTETTMQELAELVLANFDRKIRIETDGVLHPGIPRNWRADLMRLTDLGFKPQITLQRGLQSYVKWCHAEVLGE